MDIRDAVEADAPMLAGINARLIEDEWGGGTMSLERLEERMRRRINDDEYRVLLFHERGNDVAYALVTADDESAFIHHFYVMPDYRGDGLGREALELLFREVIPPTARVTLDVLASNESGRAFWRAAGFNEYSVRMERAPTVLASDTGVRAAFDEARPANLPTRGHASGDSAGQPGTADPMGPP
jgi:ribosomal protein S18 acetylase RimI-like enzyme